MDEGSVLDINFGDTLVEPRPADGEGAESCKGFKRDRDVHLLPCRVRFTGACRADAYFRPKKVKLDSGSTSLESTFRGRLLRGEETQLPDGCRGVILSQTKPPAGRESTNYSVASATFSKITRWLHDEHPTENDQLPRALKWFTIAKAIHEGPTDDSSSGASP